MVFLQSESRYTDPKHAVYEMDPSGVDTNVGARMTTEGDSCERLASELSSYKRFSWPFHEMYDPPGRPGELPATLPLELPASSLVFSSETMSPA